MKEIKLIEKYAQKPDEFPVLKEQTHKVLKNGGIVNERVNINETLINYLQDTARLISEIDGSLENKEPYDHIVYLDKSARPVSWLVNLFWGDFAYITETGNQLERPNHSYINIDRAPWFRNVGIEVTDDGRQTSDGELATYWDFANNLENLSYRHLAGIRALYIDGGIEKEDTDWIMNQPSILDGKRVLIVDEVSRTGSTLKIAERLFEMAFPDVGEVVGTYFWHPHEAGLMLGNENVLTSLPIWYDPNTYSGRGIGGLDKLYYRSLYDRYQLMKEQYPNIDLRKFRTYAFSSFVYSTPMLSEDGEILGLDKEKKTRALTKDMRRLHDEYKAGRIFFVPPFEWAASGRFESVLMSQGVILIPENATLSERERIKRDPCFYLNFIEKLKSSNT